MHVDLVFGKHVHGYVRWPEFAGPGRGDARLPIVFSESRLRWSWRTTEAVPSKVEGERKRSASSAAQGFISLPTR